MDGDEQGDLQATIASRVVQVEDLLLDVGRLMGEQRCELASLMISASCSSTIDTWVFSPNESTVLAFAWLVKDQEGTASITALANASPNDSPEEPAAALTPAASLTRSSEMGDNM
jgi:hypothetical protein